MVSKKKNYLVQKNDIVRCYFFSAFFNKKNIKNSVRKKWHGYKWRKLNKFIQEKRGRSRSKTKPNFFWVYKKKNLILNYVEINYKILTAIFLRNPYIGEILLKKKKNLTSSYLLRKIYFFY